MYRYSSAYKSNLKTYAVEIKLVCLSRTQTIQKRTQNRQLVKQYAFD